jgi:hypothetical protein
MEPTKFDLVINLKAAKTTFFPPRGMSAFGTKRTSRG